MRKSALGEGRGGKGEEWVMRRVGRNGGRRVGGRGKKEEEEDCVKGGTGACGDRQEI
jgi:hypothetical protein